ncbi:hypothetical protein BGZ96_006569 [Linnemannia gamsii]|uniref:Fungal-type protein kinase domain-containing protein n=1 Tax=Linnemannia gamsii TaxID=64522 RepID=A0ABQ7K275_9FUNG|nr:hypothetical protein BGZ96_006569 [Linnemannia gamsii]
MNNDQTRYFDSTPAYQFNLKDWAKIADSLDPTTLDQLWTSQALRRLKNSEREAERAAYNRLSRVKQPERLEIFSIVVADRKLKASLRPLVTEDKINIALLQSKDLANEVRKGKQAKRSLKSPATAETRPRVSPPSYTEEQKIHVRYPGSPTPVLSTQIPDALSAYNNDSDSNEFFQKSPPPPISPKETHVGTQPNPALSIADHFALLNQRTHWTNILPRFQEYRQEQNWTLDLSPDGIMDLTLGSRFAATLNDHDLLTILEDQPISTEEFKELTELDELLGEDCSFEVISEQIFNTPLNTPVRRFLYGVVHAYSRYFPKKTAIPALEEKQGMFAILCPFIQGALDVYHIESFMSEIAITASGERKNADKDYGERMEKSRRADMIAVDSEDNQIFLSECSSIYEKDKRKFAEDRWKLGRALKDSWDSTVRKVVQSYHPHQDLATFGIQFFSHRLVFYKMDFRGEYRLWQVDSCDIPLQMNTGFEKKFRASCRKSLSFAHMVAEEIRVRGALPFLSMKEKIILGRAAQRIKPTTDSPPFKKRTE